MPRSVDLSSNLAAGGLQPATFQSRSPLPKPPSHQSRPDLCSKVMLKTSRFRSLAIPSFYNNLAVGKPSITESQLTVVEENIKQKPTSIFQQLQQFSWEKCQHATSLSSVVTVSSSIHIKVPTRGSSIYFVVKVCRQRRKMPPHICRSSLPHAAPVPTAIWRWFPSGNFHQRGNRQRQYAMRVFRPIWQPGDLFVSLFKCKLAVSDIHQVLLLFLKKARVRTGQ